MSATLKKGLDLSLPIAVGTTLASIKGNTNLQAVAQYSANDLFRVNGYEVPGDYAVMEGDVVSVEKAACTKA